MYDNKTRNVKPADKFTKKTYLLRNFQEFCNIRYAYKPTRYLPKESAFATTCGVDAYQLLVMREPSSW